MYKILLDSEKIVKSSTLDKNHLNFVVGTDAKLSNLLKEIKETETISDIDYKKFKLRVSMFGVLYSSVIWGLLGQLGPG